MAALVEKTGSRVVAGSDVLVAKVGLPVAGTKSTIAASVEFPHASHSQI